MTALGHLGPPGGPPDLEGLDPHRLHAAVVQSKVVRLALRRLGGAEGVLPTLLRATDTAERHRHATTGALTEAVVATVASTGARVIKGLAMRPRYPEPESRHLGDIDLHVADWDAAWPLVARLRADGWPWDLMEYPWLKWDEAGLLYGQLAFLRCTDGVPVARVDVHMGAFSVGHAGRMPLVGWEPAEILGRVVPVPGRENAIALVAAHALGDTRLSMKDINDLRVLVGDGGVDWSSVVELCRCAGAVEVLGQLLAELGAVYPRSGPLPRLAYQPRLVPGGLAGEDRGSHFAWHAETDERARATPAVEAARVAGEARRYFSGDLRPHLVASGESPAFEPGAGRDVCWRLLPEPVWTQWTDAGPSHRDPAGPVHEQRLAEGLVLLRRGPARVVVIGEDVFVPTVWGDVHPDGVRLAIDTVRGTR